LGFAALCANLLVGRLCRLALTKEAQHSKPR
jgi:hypothetical protein